MQTVGDAVHLPMSVGVTTDAVPPAAAMPTVDASVVQVARQPIYDHTGQVFGYELLFRGSLDAVEAARHDGWATSQVIITAFTEFGVGELAGDRPCFVNLTREFLTGELALPFGPQQVVLEVLETVRVDDAVLAGVAALTDAGYRIALDDFVLGLGQDRLLGLASYVKLDMLDADTGRLDTLTAACRGYPDLTLIAEKLETAEHLALADRYGCELRQGYLLDRPQTLATRSISPSRARLLGLLAALADINADLEQVLATVAEDPALSMRVLRACSSAATGISTPVSSLRHAVVLLGLQQVRNWAMLMALGDATAASQDQLVDVVARARLCHHLAARTGAAADTAFTASLIASVAALLDHDPHSLADGLGLDPAITEAITTRTGSIGHVLRLADNYLHGTASKHLDPDTPHAYLNALRWATTAMHTTR
jgi:c-di-GMP-related signal transduction protein